MSDKMKATVLLVVWLAAYAVIGGAVWVMSTRFLLRTVIDDMTAIMIAGALTIALGWLGASFAQRRVAAAIADKTPAASTAPK